MPLFIFAFIGHIGHPFNLVFFSRHMGVDNNGDDHRFHSGPGDSFLFFVDRIK